MEKKPIRMVSPSDVWGRGREACAPRKKRFSFKRRSFFFKKRNIRKTSWKLLERNAFALFFLDSRRFTKGRHYMREGFFFQNTILPACDSFIGCTVRSGAQKKNNLFKRLKYFLFLSLLFFLSYLFLFSFFSYTHLFFLLFISWLCQIQKKKKER